MKVLTFVIPAYNSQQFLDKGLGSMLLPEVLDALEILVVNDGSTDGTAAVAQKYCDQYPGTVRLISQENKGHGGALNAGFAAATGKYIKPVDADDWVETQNLPEFIRLLERCESDVVLTPFHTFDIGTGEIADLRCTDAAFGKILTPADLAADWRSFYAMMTYHGIAYRADFYRENGIRFSEHVFYEDYEYACYPLCHARSIALFDLFIYDYRIGDVSQSVSDESKLRRISHLETVLHRLAREYRNASLPEGGRDYAAIKAQELLLSYFTVALLAHPDRKLGRGMARTMADAMAAEFPEAFARARKKYQVFCLMNRLHISKASWDRFLKSKLYNRLRGIL